jgi:hypothetical protein
MTPILKAMIIETAALVGLIVLSLILSLIRKKPTSGSFLCNNFYSAASVSVARRRGSGPAIKSEKILFLPQSPVEARVTEVHQKWDLRD